MKHQIIDYYRYIDDIYNMHTTNIENTLMEFRAIHQKIKFTMEKETQTKLPGLNHYKHNQLKFGAIPETHHHPI
jgi:hypothetical protein